jgi:hypothetical protein
MLLLILSSIKLYLDLCNALVDLQVIISIASTLRVLYITATLDFRLNFRTQQTKVLPSNSNRKSSILKRSHKNLPKLFLSSLSDTINSSLLLPVNPSELHPHHCMHHATFLHFIWCWGLYKDFSARTNILNPKFN